RRDRRLGLWQVDFTARDQRTRPANPGPRFARRTDDHLAAPEDRHCVPGTAPAALADGRRQCRFWTERPAGFATPPSRCRRVVTRWLDRQTKRLAARIVGRSGAARRHCACTGPAARSIAP